MTIIERLQPIFRDVFDDSNLDITGGMSPKDYPSWDSVGTVRLVLSVEQEFGIRLTTDEVAGIRNVADLVKSIENALHKV